MRSVARIRAHYEIEKELANRLRNSSRAERTTLYPLVHDELYRLVPDHPLLLPRSEGDSNRYLRTQFRFVKRFINSGVTFLEIGPGDCSLAAKVARLAKQVVAVDVSRAIPKSVENLSNFRLVISDGCSIPVPPGSIDIAYSNQLMEHLHPDDAAEQVHNIYKALAPGGVYLCVTPNRLTGPHDVSMSFDTEATGLHLKEYTITELSTLFEKEGFSRVHAYVGARGRYLTLPVGALVLVERMLWSLPQSIRRRIALTLPFRMILNIRLRATK
jgi:SAM-dependent methyltransferase